MAIGYNGQFQRETEFAHYVSQFMCSKNTLVHFIVDIFGSYF